MKTNFHTDCGAARETLDAAFDSVFEAPDDSGISLLSRLRFRLHCFFCPRCAELYRRVLDCGELSRTGFFPDSPSFEDAVMTALSGEAVPDQGEAVPGPAGGFSFRAWAIIGCFLLISLPTAFFGVDFIALASRLGSSFLVPLGITIGIVLTGYGAFFIGSHLKELSEHFKIR